MALMYKATPSSLLAIDDPYAAWCIDQAITEYILRIRAGQKLLPPDTQDNTALIKKMQKQSRKVRK